MCFSPAADPVYTPADPGVCSRHAWSPTPPPLHGWMAQVGAFVLMVVEVVGRWVLLRGLEVLGEHEQPEPLFAQAEALR